MTKIQVVIKEWFCGVLRSKTSLLKGLQNIKTGLLCRLLFEYYLLKLSLWFNRCPFVGQITHVFTLYTRKFSSEDLY